MPMPTPTEVDLYVEDLSVPRFTPRELEAVKSHFGLDYAEIAQDSKDSRNFVLQAWLKLRRAGHTLGLEEMADVVIAVRAGESGIPPTSGGDSEPLPPSATSGG